MIIDIKNMAVRQEWKGKELKEKHVYTKKGVEGQRIKPLQKNYPHRVKCHKIIMIY